jgi:predicted dehydrogenase
MNANGRFRIGIVGCGYWGVNYVRVFNELPDSVVTHVCDQRQERLEMILHRFRGTRTSLHLEQFLDDGDLDAVVIATPASGHFEVAKACLEHDKHVLVEKPITTNSSDASTLVDLAGDRNLVLMVGHTFLFNAGVQATKQHLDSQEAGRIYYLHATRTNLGPIRTDVNAVWDLAPHDVSIFDYLLGVTPEWVSAVGSCVLGNCREDVGFVTLGYPDGVIGNIHVSWADPNKVREVVVVGSRMRIVFNDLDPQERVRVFHKGISAVPSEVESFGEFRFLLRDGDIVSPLVESSEPLKNQSAHFLECIRNGTTPLSDGAVALRVVKVMEAIDRSMQKKGAPVPV